ncbi:O-methyltransferase [Saccharothrix syringae]|uniref:SAM-dependent methyltransferase n=1 Tax=Saccharothrix syringae TaxID=103733 RepID=A0A5Q0H1K2_SACSY|nr:class I SAM-dependent methyltransferase [Saccharothrix syringae]QFZ20147.1 SAM-dependent methyltransferase [Saccharothrix syringae]
MANQVELSPGLLDYIREVSLRDDPVLRELREETAALPAGAAMQVMAEEGQLLALLVAATGARSVLEVGTFTGYSTLCLARAVPAGGRVTTCDVVEKWPRIGRPHWERAGVADRIDLRLGPAADTLRELRAERGPASFDLAFIDADKANYRVYYEHALDLVRPGGLVVIDNTLLFGRVLEPAAQDPDTVAIRELNAFIATDPRVEPVLLPLADGVTLARLVDA